MARPTIIDIARAAGVSSTAVSFALNGRPGVAEPTRARIHTIAQDLGWTPNAAARALSTSRVNALGLIITAPYEELSRDTFFLRFIAGVEQALASSPVALVLKIVDNFELELDAIRQWHGECRADGLILVNPRPEDPRPALVNQLGIPAVFIGAPGTSEPFSSVYIDDALVMRTLVTDLAERGSHSIEYVHTHADFAHSKARLAALHETADARITHVADFPVHGPSIEDEYRRLRAHFVALGEEAVPDTIVCENEDLTLATLAALRDLGIAVPEQVGVVSWESSPGLTSRRPFVSTLERSPAAMGMAAVDLLDELRISGGGYRQRELPGPRLHARDTLPQV